MAVAALALACSIASPRGAAADSPWGASYFPNVPLVTQDGKTVRFYDDLLKDKKVIISFIFTHCEQWCPLTTAKLAQVRDRLGARIGSDVFIYSITLDPENDTPEALKAYSEAFGGAGGPGWLFLTGKPEDVGTVRYKLGQRTAKEIHGNDLLLGANGVWMKFPPFDDIDILVARIKVWLDAVDGAAKTAEAKPGAARPAPSFADATPLELPEDQRLPYLGRTLFIAKCAACHSFGKDRLGPDLAGVTTRRDRAWLARYIAFPARVRAEGDPIASELHAKFKVPMPDLGLSQEDLDKLLAFLDAQAKAQARAAAAKQPDPPAKPQ